MIAIKNIFCLKIPIDILHIQVGHQRRINCGVETEGTAPTHACHVHQGITFYIEAKNRLIFVHTLSEQKLCVCNMEANYKA